MVGPGEERVSEAFQYLKGSYKKDRDMREMKTTFSGVKTCNMRSNYFRAEKGLKGVEGMMPCFMVVAGNDIAVAYSGLW